MRVGVAAPGRFHTFDLAGQLQRLGHLGHLYTGYPRWKVQGFSPDKVVTFPWVMTPLMACSRLGLFKFERALQWPAIESFDRWVSKVLRPCDIFYGLPSFGVKSQQVAREKFGAITVSEGSSTHILHRDAILATEHARWGVPYTHIDRRIIDHTIQEYEYCDLITAASHHVYRTFVAHGVKREKIVILPYGVDLSLFRPHPKRDNVFRVIYVGSGSVSKGIFYLLEAIRKLELPGFQVWFIGGITDDVKVKLGPYEGRAQFLGFRHRTTLAEYYSQGSVFVMPSVDEGLALVQAQAMACGLPVIATVNTGAEELFTDGVEGFIVPIRDPEAIREKILYLYENPASREVMAAAALRRVKLFGGWEQYGERAVGYYAAAMERHSPPATVAEPMRSATV
jgi:alpha-maltose-1-phosphate synthase